MAGQPTSEDPQGAGGARVGVGVLGLEEIVFLGILNLGIFAPASCFLPLLLLLLPILVVLCVVKAN